MYKRFLMLGFLFFLALGVVTCTDSNHNFNTVNSSLTSSSQKKEYGFRIWWIQGFLPEENELITSLVDGWQKETGLKAELTLIPANNLDSEVKKAIDKGTPPDILYSSTADTNLIPALAWRNQLADVSDLIEPIKNLYTPSILKAVYYQNNQTKKRSYYSVPIAQQTVHIFYWKDLLAKAGLPADKVPKQWNKFWNFWEEAQDRLRQKGQHDVYGVGLCMSALGTDTFLGFEEFLEAYNVKILDEQGQLLLDNPDTRKGIINALKFYSEFYQKHYVPKNAVDWTDSGNNISFLESQSLMTVNSTLSIPLTQKLEPNTYNKQSTDLYLNKIVTAEWPEKPDGETLKSILGVKQIVVFEASKHKDAAKSFLSYLLKPENLNLFLKKGTKGRFIPVMPKLLEDSFWKDPADPHTAEAIRQLNGLTRPGYEVFHPAYSAVQDQNIWAQAILSIIQKGVPPEQAADNAIREIKQIFAQWK